AATALLVSEIGIMRKLQIGALALTHTLSHPYAHSASHTHTHAHTQTHTHIHTLSHTHMHTHPHTHAQTQIQMQTHIHTHTHKHTHFHQSLLVFPLSCLSLSRYVFSPSFSSCLCLQARVQLGSSCHCAGVSA